MVIFRQFSPKIRSDIDFGPIFGKFSRNLYHPPTAGSSFAPSHFRFREIITLRFEKWSISGLLTFNNRLVSLSRFFSVVFFRSLGAQAVLIEMNHLSSLTMGDEATASKYFSTPEGKKRFRR